MKVELLWFVGLFALFILAWKPLHRRFRGLGILCAYLLFALAMVAPIFAPHDRDTWSAFFMLVVMAILTLLMYRQKPIEKRRPTVAWAVIHGLWDQLAKEGIPADEIERLKKLTQEERARLMASLMASVERTKRGVLQKKARFESDFESDLDLYGTLSLDFRSFNHHHHH